MTNVMLADSVLGTMSMENIVAIYEDVGITLCLLNIMGNMLMVNGFERNILTKGDNV